MSGFLTLSNGLPIMTAGPSSSYDQSIYYASGLTASTPITLPSSGYFSTSTASDIIILVNDRWAEVTRDFTVLGSGPNYTQIQFNYALPNDAVVRFKSHLS